MTSLADLARRPYRHPLHSDAVVKLDPRLVPALGCERSKDAPRLQQSGRLISDREEATFLKLEATLKQQARADFDYFLDAHEMLVQRYGGRVVVIKEQRVIGDYATYREAYFCTQQNHALGTFIIQLCTPGDSGYTRRASYRENTSSKYG